MNMVCLSFPAIPLTQPHSPSSPAIGGLHLWFTFAYMSCILHLCDYIFPEILLHQYSCQSISDGWWFQGVKLLTQDIDEMMITSLSSHFTDSCVKWAQIWFTGIISRSPNCTLHIWVRRTIKERKGSSESMIYLYHQMPIKVDISSGVGNWTMCSIWARAAAAPPSDPTRMQELPVCWDYMV
jgi:hypothetical protein